MPKREISDFIFVKKAKLSCVIAAILYGHITISTSAYATELSCVTLMPGSQKCSGQKGFKNPDVDAVLNQFDSVEIIATNDINPSYRKQHALEFHRAGDNLITTENLILKTYGDLSNGINLQQSNVVLTGKVSIETAGKDSAGILLDNNDLSTITVGDNLEIYSANGMGIAAEVTSYESFFWVPEKGNIITIGQNASIRTAGEGFNGGFSDYDKSIGRGYGVYSGAYYFINNSRGINHYTYSALVRLGHNARVETQGDKAHGVYANKTGLIETGDISVTTYGHSASGIVAEDGIMRGGISSSPVQPLINSNEPGTTIETNNRDGRSLNGENISSEWPSAIAGVNENRERAFDGGRIYLTRDVNVLVNGEGSNAFHSTGKNAYIGSAFLDGPISEGIYTIRGDMLADRKGEIDLRMIQNSLFYGAADSTQLNSDGQINTTDNGYINLDIKGTNSLWDMTASSVITRMDLNDAHIAWHAPAGNESFRPAYLTVVDNFAGNNGLLTLNTVLGGDDSLTDQMHVLGDVEPGVTRVLINNIGGKGALTDKGIEIITVGGQSYGSFVKSSRIVAGAYDYDVVRKGEDWYLTSTITPPVNPNPGPGTDPNPGPGTDPNPGPGTDPNPEPGTDPKPGPGTDPNPNPGTDPNPGPGTGPEPEPGPQIPLVRPEPGAYLANHAAANNLFIMRLHDRLGETQYTDALTGEKKVTSLWLRQVGGHNVFHSAGQLTTQSNRYIAQLGGDIAQWSSDEKDRWHLGIMGGYANNQSNTRSRWSDYRADGTLSGYSAGIYGTWYADNENKEGLYTDTWLIYSWLNNKVSGNELSSESYKSRGFTASLEAGWTEEIDKFYGSHGSLNTWYLQPKAQAIWMGVRSHSLSEDNGTTVSFGGNGNIQTRLGLRAYINGYHKMDIGKKHEFEPFVEMNWIHNTRTFSATLDNLTIKQEGSRNIGEIKTGVEAKLGDKLNMWGNVAVQMGGNGYHDASAMYGIKYQF